MQSQLQKAIELAKKTGDKLIVFDSAKPDSIYVVMNIDDYENLVFGKSEVRGLTENELLDKINRDVAIWKSDQDFKNDFREEKQSLVENFDFNKLNFTDFDINNQENQIDNDQDKKGGNYGWNIPREIKAGAEEIIDEDRQYLEEI